IAFWQELFVDEDVDPTSNTVASLRAWPNPFAAQCTIELMDAAESAGSAGSLHRAGVRSAGGAVPIEIFDISGRRVRLLSSEVGGNGTVRWQWNGQDDGGRTAAAGVYFVRFPDRSQAPLKLLRVR
ncbi:MAG TPA: FlgD immunoglobulin-like domain containing protein, partial [bacterium]|nr:FlgD immunoglobulin-like domain containing protein [bacterium]